VLCARFPAFLIGISVQTCSSGSLGAARSITVGGTADSFAGVAAARATTAPQRNLTGVPAAEMSVARSTVTQ
jgi:hypothetical protein